MEEPKSGGWFRRLFVPQAGSGGRKKLPRWVMVMGGLIGVGVGLTQMIEGVREASGGLPRCEGSSAEGDVKRVSSSLSSLRATPITLTGLEAREQVSSTDEKRSCKGMAVLSDGSRHPISYAFTKLADGKIDVSLALLMVPPCQSARAQELILAYFDKTDEVKAAGITGVGLSGQRQASGTEDDRMCKATITLSDKSQRSFNYRLLMKDEQIYAAFEMD